MKRLGKKDGLLELEFEPHEVEFLLGLAEKIPPALESAGNHRLFPAHTEDKALDQELRTWLHPELKAARQERALAFQRELHAAFKADGVARLNDEAMDRWICVLNDLRLIFAGELGIDADDWPTRLTKEQRESSCTRAAPAASAAPRSSRRTRRRTSACPRSACPR
jgi:hypothetical protein